MNKSLINVLGFQIGWFSCVLGAAHGMPWLGLLVALPVMGWHLTQANNPRLELGWIIPATLIGSLFDQTLLSAGLLQYPASAWPASLLPVWMMVLWLLFFTTLNVSLRWMRKRHLVAIVFGLVGGPLAYLAGARMGAMQLLDKPMLLIIVGLGWAVITPLTLWVSSKYDGYIVTKTGHLNHV